ncbi:MAG: hypothetical protein MJE77_26430 [Proteobacteria bacterium]|nr:hypothetical protein [Pseudomonadota bacterium]
MRRYRHYLLGPVIFGLVAGISKQAQVSPVPVRGTCKSVSVRFTGSGKRWIERKREVGATVARVAKAWGLRRPTRRDETADLDIEIRVEERVEETHRDGQNRFYQGCVYRSVAIRPWWVKPEARHGHQVGPTLCTGVNESDGEEALRNARRKWGRQETRLFGRILATYLRAQLRENAYAVRVRSEPSGADVAVERIGYRHALPGDKLPRRTLVTPAVISCLPKNANVRFDLHKPGYQSRYGETLSATGATSDRGEFSRTLFSLQPLDASSSAGDGEADETDGDGGDLPIRPSPGRAVATSVGAPRWVIDYGPSVAFGLLILFGLAIVRTRLRNNWPELQIDRARLIRLGGSGKRVLLLVDVHNPDSSRRSARNLNIEITVQTKNGDELHVHEDELPELHEGNTKRVEVSSHLSVWLQKTDPVQYIEVKLRMRCRSGLRSGQIAARALFHLPDTSKTKPPSGPNETVGGGRT